jgi:hypothetical protein
MSCPCEAAEAGASSLASPKRMLCWLLGTSVRKVDGLVLVFLTYLQLELFADEGVQEHLAYLQAFAKPSSSST